jgi:hypothetical protein
MASAEGAGPVASVEGASEPAGAPAGSPAAAAGAPAGAPAAAGAGATAAAVARVYELGKDGRWDAVRRAFAEEPTGALAGAAVRWAKPTSTWTLLHQAAYWGDAAAVRLCVKYGATIDAADREGRTPAAVAAGRGHDDVAALLLRLGESGGGGGGGGAWSAPSPDPLVRPWGRRRDSTVRERRASRAFLVSYGGGRVPVPAGARYYVDEGDRAIVGWHGTFDPPRGMDGEPLI